MTRAAPPAPPPPSAVLRVVAFDLDGTLTWTDSFLAFLRARETGPAFRRKTRALAPAGLAWLFGRIDRGALKARVATQFLRGAPVEAVRREATAFWETGAGAGLLRADALAALRAHVAAGDAVVFVTACPEPVAAPLAARLGAACLATRLETTDDGRLTGRLAGANCRGAEKVARLRAVYGEDMVLVAAYGDSAGDREMLAAAEASFYRRFRD